MSAPSQTTATVERLVVRDADAPRAKRKSPKRKVSKNSSPKKEQLKKAPKAPKKKASRKTTTPTAKKAKTKTNTSTKTKSSGTTKTPAQRALIELKYTSSRPALPRIKQAPLGHLLFEQLLREAGFRGGISTDKKVLDRFSTDESIFAVHPQVVIQPRNKEDLEVAVKTVATHTKKFSALSLTPRGAGTGLSGGSLSDSIILDVCAHLDAVDDVLVRKDGVYITCEPGANFCDIERTLKIHDAYLPAAPSSKDICTIGGAVANNAAGPDSLRFGNMAHSVTSLDVVLADGNTYTIEPITYKEFKALSKKKNEYGRILRDVYALIEQNEKAIAGAKPTTRKNTAGYALWDVIDGSLEDFKNKNARMDLTRLISGSQGSLGIISSITLRAEWKSKKSTLIAVPIFELSDLCSVITSALSYNPLNIEVFDALSYDLALKNPNYFRKNLSGMEYYKVLFSMYSNYHIRYGRRIPEFTLLITLDEETTHKTHPSEIVREIRGKTNTKARIIYNPYEVEMYWQIRRASYTLSKLQDTNKRPAAFLEDISVPPENLSRFLLEIKRLLKKYNISATMHGHGGNGHFHFYPLIDFTNKSTPSLIEKMAEEFFATAIKFNGSICGEHNDGIIRTPHLSKMFKRTIIALFEKTEHIFDPDNIFNPGKKVNPRYDIKQSIRKTN